MTEKSGINMLEELVQEVRLMRKEIKVLEHNIKRIANSAKISELAAKAMGTPFEDWTRSEKTSKSSIEPVNADDLAGSKINKKNIRFNFEPTDASKSNQVQPSRSSRQPAVDSCMCQGKMVAEYKGSSVPLPGLDVKVYDDKDQLVKETKTNRAGMWMSKLMPGNYVANIEGKYGGQDLYPINLSFVVKPGVSKMEVK